MNTIWQHILPTTDEEMRTRLLATVVVILVLWAIKHVLLVVLRSRVKDLPSFHFWRKAISYSHAAVVMLIVGNIWFKGVQAIGTFLGLVSAGLAIALHDMVSNLAGWLFLVTRRPFKVGDRVEINGFKGDVIDIRPFQFSVIEIGKRIDAEQSTGRIVNIPNSIVLKEPLANYSTGFDHIWHEIPVLLTFESDWRKAKTILLKIADENAEQLSAGAEEQTRRAAMQYLIFFSKLTPVVYTSVRDSGVLLTIRYMVRPKRLRGSEEAFWEAILEAFSEHADIDFAYPTTRYYRPGEEPHAQRPADVIPEARV
ncbi:MAG: mechanosensitive ion channel family protein [Verrucomicrobia bacterium]|nr:mechanosensitive ion channel family protein [Verrucomicrobiota bacterium]